jgi:hypothetical protein
MPSAAESEVIHTVDYRLATGLPNRQSQSTAAVVGNSHLECRHESRSATMGPAAPQPRIRRCIGELRPWHVGRSWLTSTQQCQPQRRHCPPRLSMHSTATELTAADWDRQRPKMAHDCRCRPGFSTTAEGHPGPQPEFTQFRTGLARGHWPAPGSATERPRRGPHGDSTFAPAGGPNSIGRLRWLVIPAWPSSTEHAQSVMPTARLCRGGKWATHPHGVRCIGERVKGFILSSVD